jgi:hypothetical protein
MRCRDRADTAFGNEFAQPIDRQDHVDIALKSGAIEVDRDVAHQDVGAVPTRWHGTVFARADRKRRVAATDQSSAADDRHTALGQFWSRDEGRRLERRAGQVSDCGSCRFRYVIKSRHSVSS